MLHSRHILLWVIMCVIFFLFTVSCSKKDQNNEQTITPNKNTLNFRITWKEYSGRGEAIQKIVDLYNKKNNDGYEIKVVGGDEDVMDIESLLAMKASNQIYVLPYRYVKYFGDKGYLSDLTASFAQDKNMFYPELWKLGQADGVTYGIPWMGHSICLIYNKSLLDKAGVEVASIKNLSSLVQAMEMVEAKTQAKGIGLVGANHNDVSWMVNQFIYGFGSNLVDGSGKKVAINNAKSRAALDFYKNTLGKHAQQTWVDDTGLEVMEYFRKQQVAFEMQGVWGVTDIKKNGNPFEVGIIALQDIGLYSEVGPMMLSIPKDMDKADKDEARRFIKFLISKQAQEEVMVGEYSPEHDAYYPFRTPVRKNLTDSLVFKKYPEYVPFLIGFKRPSVDVPVPKWQTVKDLYYAPGLHQVMKGEITIDDFLNMIELKGNDILKNES